MIGKIGTARLTDEVLADIGEDICLKRAPGTCCPEPSCDYKQPCIVCGNCGKECSFCERNK